MIENNKVSDEELLKVSGGKKIEVYEYNIFDVENKRQKAGFTIKENGEIVEAWGLEKLTKADKDHIPDDIKKILGL